MKREEGEREEREEEEREKETDRRWGKKGWRRQISMRILTVLLLKERGDGSAAPVPPSDTTCTHKIEEEKKRKLGCESGKEGRGGGGGGERRAGHGGGGEEEEEGGGGGSRASNARTNRSPNKEIKDSSRNVSVFGQRWGVCVCDVCVMCVLL